MLLAAGEHGCASEVLTIAAALSVQDPRDFPADHLEQARQAHAVDRHEKSDFLGLLNLWQRYRRATRELSRRQRTRWCREHFLSGVRMREWRNVRDQLNSIARELKIPINKSPAPEAAVHKALLTGLLGNIARRHTDNEYLGTQGKKLYIHRGSALFKTKPKWLMCAELVHTGRLYARTVAAIDPAWVETPASHLVKRQYLDPYWDARRGEVRAKEQVTLYGLTLVQGRRVRYARVDPVESREIFIRQALVPGDVEPPPDFLRHNLEMIQRAAEIEHRERRRGVVIDDERLADFYRRRLPADVCDMRSLAVWLKSASRESVQALYLDEETARPGPLDEHYPDRFPDHIEVSGNRLPLRYRFEPGHPYDGVTLSVPAPLVGQLPAERLSWLVPGLLVEKMTALIRALPKDTRRALGPANDAAFFCLQHMAPRDDESLTQCMSRTFREERGIRVPVEQWDETALQPHLRMNVEVTDSAGEVLAHGRDPAALRERIADAAPMHETDNEPLPSWVKSGLTAWTIDKLPESIEHRRAGVKLRSFVALQDDGDSVSVALYDREVEAREAMAAGVGRLLRLQAADRLKYLRRNLPQIDRMCLNFAAVGSCEALRRDIIDASVARACTTDPWRIRSRAAFDAEADRLRQRIVPVSAEICRTLAPALELLRKCLTSLDTLPAESRNDIAQQLDLLVFPGFVAYTPTERLDSLQRYLHGVRKRIERCPGNPRQDAARLQRIAGYWNRLLLEYPPPPDPVPPELFEFRWMLEEFRISVFAQELGTAQPVSEKRLDEQWDRYRRSAP